MKDLLSTSKPPLLSKRKNAPTPAKPHLRYTSPILQAMHKGRDKDGRRIPVLY